MGWSLGVFAYMQDDFGNLTHLVSLDLSKNQLCRLPDSFGNLTSLKKLDLYGNQLTSLPLTFWKLKKLNLLDLKKNQLEGELQEVAAKCVSPADCTRCATQVLICEGMNLTYVQVKKT